MMDSQQDFRELGRTSGFGEDFQSRFSKLRRVLDSDGLSVGSSRVGLISNKH